MAMSEITLDDIRTVAIQLAAILGALGVVARWAWPRIRRSLACEMQRIVDQATDPIRSEVEHNHGASMKDKVAELDRKVSAMHRRLDVLGSVPSQLSQLAVRLDLHMANHANQDPRHQHYTTRLPDDPPDQ